MDLKKYDKLRKKINAKDFEGNNKSLDKWLYGFSYLGNISAIFFAYFLVYPSLLKTITINFINGIWGALIAIIFTITFLSIFEITKRYFIKNFAGDYFANRKRLNAQSVGWFTLSITIIALSFYLSIAGSKNLAITSLDKNTIIESNISLQIDSLSKVYEKKIKIYENDNEALRKVNNDLRNTLAQTPISYVSVRREYQVSIDKNIKIIENNQAEINKLNAEYNKRINEINEQFNIVKSGNRAEDNNNIFLFIIIVTINELIIIGGIYFREFYEYKLFEINQQRFEKIYQKKDRYRSLLAFVYADGKLTTGDKVISGLELKTLLSEKTNISNSNKLVDEFLQDMDRLNVFSTTGKRRFIATTYNEALNIIENFDDTLRILENMR